MYKSILWWFFAVLCTVIGFYPLLYFFMDRRFGLLSSKSETLLNNPIWNTGFYGHIIFGGLALLLGWLQFSKKLRSRYIKWHRLLGKVYVLSVLISGVCGVYIGIFATGGIIPSLGFISLGVLWLTFTFLAWRAIQLKEIERHENYMIMSYAACFAAVTLRLWLPGLISLTGDFVTAYQIVAWLCWVPNMLVGWWLIRSNRSKVQTTKHS